MCTLITFASAYGDSVASASTISMDRQYTGTISNTNTVDYFKFTLNESGALNVTASAYMEWIYYDLYDASGNELWENNARWNEVSKQSVISETLYLTSGTYYFAVVKDGNRTGNYSFRLSFESSKETFKEKQGGNNNSMAEANDVDFAKTYKGMIALNDTADFYKIVLPTTGALKIDSITKLQWIYFNIYDANGEEMLETNPNWNENTLRSVNSDTIYLNSGIYYIAFSKDGNRTGEYSFKLSFTSSCESFKEAGFGSNNSFATANSITLNKSYIGAICKNDNKDIYKITVSSDMNIVLDYNAKGIKWIYIEIFDSVGNSVEEFNPLWNSTTETTNIKEIVALTKGIYYLSIYEDGGYSNSSPYGIYSFKISDGKPGKTSKIVANPKSNEIKLSWKSVEGATGYRVYKYNYNKKKYVTLTTIDGTKYTVKKLSANTKYRFAVKAYTVINGEKIWSNSYTIADTETCPAIVSKITASQTTSTITLKWNKASGATGYRIYLYNTKTKKWDSLKTTTSTRYKVEKLKVGTVYKFRIKAYKKVDGNTIWGNATSTFKTATKTKTPELTKVTTTKGKATLTHTDVSGETGYTVYYSTKKDSGFKKYANFKANTKTAAVTGLTSGKTYYFKVRTYIKTDSGYVYSAWSNIKGIKVK